MARKKTLEAIEISKVKSDMSKLQEQKRRIEADTIMEANLKSSKNFDEIMTFLSP